MTKTVEMTVDDSIRFASFTSDLHFSMLLTYRRSMTAVISTALEKILLILSLVVTDLY